MNHDAITTQTIKSAHWLQNTPASLHSQDPKLDFIQNHFDIKIVTYF